MSNRLIATVAFGAALVCSVAVAGAAEKASQKFITAAIQGNLAEVSMGQLAQQKGQSEAVKSFGQQLQSDHSAALQKATAAATQLGVTPPTEPTKKQKADHDKMAKLSGEKFDRAFAQHMAVDHRKAIAEYERAAKVGKGDAAAGYASEALPTLKSHLEAAQSLSKPGARSM